MLKSLLGKVLSTLSLWLCCLLRVQVQCKLLSHGNLERWPACCLSSFDLRQSWTHSHVPTEEPSLCQCAHCYKMQLFGCAVVFLSNFGVFRDKYQFAIYFDFIVEVKLEHKWTQAQMFPESVYMCCDLLLVFSGA